MIFVIFLKLTQKSTLRKEFNIMSIINLDIKIIKDIAVGTIQVDYDQAYISAPSDLWFTVDLVNSDLYKYKDLYDLNATYWYDLEANKIWLKMFGSITSMMQVRNLLSNRFRINLRKLKV